LARADEPGRITRRAIQERLSGESQPEFKNGRQQQKKGRPDKREFDGGDTLLIA
jgi:hypothetical protein